MKKHENIYPVGSQTPTLYGNPKLHEPFTDVPSLRPDVSFIVLITSWIYISVRYCNHKFHHPLAPNRRGHEIVGGPGKITRV